jgi:hypothetical protein
MASKTTKASKVARDAELTKEARALVVQIGLTVRTACKRVGITTRTYYYHLNQRPQGKAEAPSTPDQSA